MSNVRAASSGVNFRRLEPAGRETPVGQPLGPTLTDRPQARSVESCATCDAAVASGALLRGCECYSVRAHERRAVVRR